jgi:hypothetical protein
MSRLSFALLIAGLWIALPQLACADDDLNKFVEQNRILAQKVKTEANYAMVQARVVQKADPEQAKALLEKALKQVQNSTALSANDQTQLTSQLLGRIREVGEILRERKVASEQAPLRELPKRSGTEPAGTGVSGVAQKFIEKGNAGVDADRGFKEEQNKGFGATVGSIAKSSVPPTDDVMFPKDWAAKTKLREKYAGAQLSPKEAALVKALNSVMSVNFEGNTLRQVIDYLQERTGQAIIIDPASLKEANSDYGDPINFKVNKVTFRTILRKVLADVGLTYVIQEGTIQCVTQERARQMMVVRTYPISDIVAPNGFQLRFGPFIAHAQMLSNVQTLMNIIQSSVDPTIWREGGGGGNISFHEPSMSLIIRAPAEFHYQFAGGGMFGGSR